MSLFVLLCLFWSGMGGGVPQLSADQALLPPDGFLGHWRRAGRPRVFTSGDLYGRIDGGAELFLEFGFEQLTVQNYSGASAGPRADPQAAEFQLEIYRMADPIAATGIYLLKCGKESRDAAFSERHTINNYQLTFKRSRYYVVVNNTGGDEKLRPGMVEFARFIAARLPAEEPVALADSLPREGIIPDSVRLARGPYALQAIYTLGEGDILQLHRSITAVAADYQGDSGRKTLIQIDYPDQAAAAAAFRHLQTNLDSYLKIEARSARKFLFKDYAGEYGLGFASGRRVTVEVHLAARPSLP
jgi:hypothetical protein